MKISTVITSFIAITSALPSPPIHKTDLSTTLPYTDAEILNFILSLENFQYAFYRQGLANFTQAQFASAGYNSDFYSNLKDIESQEHTHVTSLTSTLKSLNIAPVAECTYFFNVTTPSVFVTDASLIEAVSVSSYIGLLANLKNVAYLKVYSSVLAVEARHSSFVRAALGERPFPSPYDTPTDLDETFTLVRLFTVECPGEGNPLALKNYPTLSSSFSNRGVIGREVTFVTFGKDIRNNSPGCDAIYAAFLTLTGPVFAPTIRLPNNSGFNTTVPATPEGFAPISGLIYVVLSSSNTTLTDDNILAGPASIEIRLK